MKNKLKKAILIILTSFILVSLITIYFGIKEYKTLISEKPIDNRINEVVQDVSFVSFNEISEMTKEAIVTTEDVRFYNRKSPIDFRAVARALKTNIKYKRIMEGASTIPQQVAKNLYLDHEFSMQRKVTEYLIAKDILEDYSHDEVLTIYLNIIYYGDGHYGINEASQGYFNKKPIDLNDYEATLLVGLPQAPSYFALTDHYDRARVRQKHVLNRLVYEGKLTEQEAKEIYNEGDVYEKEND